MILHIAPSCRFAAGLLRRTVPAARRCRRKRPRSNAWSRPAASRPGWCSEPSLPLVALNFAFIGGAAQDPPTSRASATWSRRCSTTAPAKSTPRRFQRSSRTTPIELRFSVQPRLFLRHRSAAEGAPGAELRPVAARAQPAALRRRRGRPRARADPGRSCGAKPPTRAASPTATWWRTAFPGHPYGRPTSGTLTSMPTITADDLRTYVQQVFTRDTLKVAAVGDIDAATLGQTLDRVFGSLPASGTRVAVPDAPMREGGRRIVVAAQRAAGRGAHGRRRHHAQGSGFHPGLSWSTTSSAAARSPRGSMTRCARSAASPMASIPTCWLDAPRRHVHGRHRRPRPTAPARRWS